MLDVVKNEDFLCVWGVAMPVIKEAKKNDFALILGLTVIFLVIEYMHRTQRQSKLADKNKMADWSSAMKT